MNPLLYQLISAIFQFCSTQSRLVCYRWAMNLQAECLTTDTHHLLHTKYNDIMIRVQPDLPQILTVEPCTAAETQPEGLQFRIRHKPRIQFHTVSNKAILCSCEYLFNKIENGVLHHFVQRFHQGGPYFQPAIHFRGNHLHAILFTSIREEQPSL